MFRKVLLALGLLLLCSATGFCQSTTVSGTITDAGAQTWNNGTFNFVFVPSATNPVGPYTWPGGAIPANIGGSLSGTGTYSVSIPSNTAISPIQTTWTATFCPQASSPCFTVSNITITSATQTLNATPPTILINLQSAQPPVLAYTNSEISGAALGSQYFNLVSGTLQTCTAISGNNCTTWSAGTATNATNLVGPGAITGSFSGTHTETGNVTFTGALNPKFIAAEEYASAFAGADCGAKITNAIAALPSNGGTVKINQACGVGTGAAPWSAVSSSLNFLTLDFIEPGNYFSGGITLTGVGSSIRGLPCASGVAGLQCPVTVTEGNALNLPALVAFNTGGYGSLRDLTLDGNLTNNPTGGACFKASNSPRDNIQNVTFQNCATHGKWFFSTAGTNAGCCSKVLNSMSLNNNGDATLIQNTSDIFMVEDENESQGINPIVNTQNAATGGCAANCVTWVSGPKWSTDSSLVGTAIRLNNVRTPPLFFIASIQSSTVLTLNNAPGTQTGVQFNNGNAIENSGGGAMRFIGGEASGSTLSRGMDGILAYCTTATNSGSFVIDGNGLGNNNQNDIELVGFDPVGATNCLFGAVISGNKFSGGSTKTPTNIWDNVMVWDGGQHVIGPNYYNAGGTSFAKYGVELNETSLGRAQLNNVSGSFSGSYGTAEVLDNNFLPSGLFVSKSSPQVTSLQGHNLVLGNGSARTTVTSTCGSFCAFSLPVGTSGTLALNPPAAAGTTDLGTTALPFGNLWLGTAATNNYKFQPGATAAARTISIVDPLGNTNLVLTPAAGTVRSSLHISDQGTACANGNIVLSAGWGTTATTTAAAGQGQTCQFTLTSSGTGQAATPTITDTLPTALPSASVVCTAQMVGGTGANTLINQTTLSATAPVFTFAGTPGAGSTYFVVIRCGP